MPQRIVVGGLRCVYLMREIISRSLTSVTISSCVLAAPNETA